jgi:hypothetical protein
MCLRVNCPKSVLCRLDAHLRTNSPSRPRPHSQVPLEKYTSGLDINMAAKYILWRFMQANRARLSVYPQYANLFLPRSSLSLVC